MSIFVCGDIHSTIDIDKLNELKSREDLDKNDSFSKLQIVWILKLSQNPVSDVQTALLPSPGKAWLPVLRVC